MIVRIGRYFWNNGKMKNDSFLIKKKSYWQFEEKLN